MSNYTITSAKTSEDFSGTFDEAVARAKAINDEYQPAFGVQIEEDGETVWDTEDPEFYA